MLAVVRCVGELLCSSAEVSFSLLASDEVKCSIVSVQVTVVKRTYLSDVSKAGVLLFCAPLPPKMIK